MRFATSALILLWLATSLSAATIHVPTEQPTIQAGIDAADSTGDTVLVAPGTYSGEGNKAIRFFGKTIVLTSEAGPEATILSTDSGRTFTLQDGETNETVIEGFTIDGNSTDTWNPTRPLSGGVLMYNSAATIRNCLIRNCYAREGGGLYAAIDSGVRITGCEISNNHAQGKGGGLFIGDFDVLVSGCRIVSNQADGSDGGGVWFAGSGKFLSCYIGQNRCLTRGGGLYSGDSQIEIDSCCIAQNSADRGGAIYQRRDGLSLTRSILYNNIGRTAYAGVCISDFHLDIGPSASITYSTFVCNYGANPAGDGIAIITTYEDVPPDRDDLGRFRTHMAISDSVIVRDNIFAFNASTPIYNYYSVPPVDVSHNNVWHVVSGPKYAGDLTDQTGLNGNFSADPLFCSVSDSTLTLDALSPCVSAGSDGGTIGANGIGCNNYAAGLPQKTVVHVPADTLAIDDSVQAAFSLAKPWDTLYFPDWEYDLHTELIIDKPLYLLGRRPDSTGFAFTYIDHPTGLTLRSFAVVQGIDLEAIDVSAEQFSVCIEIDSVSPILFNCATYASGWFNIPDGINVYVRAGSPLVRAVESAALFAATAIVNESPLDVIATYCYWHPYTNEFDIADIIYDGNDNPNLGKVIFKPFLVNAPTDVDDNGSYNLPTDFALHQNYPNPFNPSTTISFDLPRAEEVTLVVYNLLGQEVARLLENERLAAGTHQVTWDAQDAATGVYLYRVETPSHSDSRKMLLLR